MIIEISTDYDTQYSDTFEIAYWHSISINEQKTVHSCHYTYILLWMSLEWSLGKDTDVWIVSTTTLIIILNHMSNRLVSKSYAYLVM